MKEQCFKLRNSPREGCLSNKDLTRMCNDPSLEPWPIPGMEGGSTHALRLTANSLGVLG